MFVKCCKLRQQFHLSRLAPLKTFRPCPLFALLLTAAPNWNQFSSGWGPSEGRISQCPCKRHSSWTYRFPVELQTSVSQICSVMKEPKIFEFLNHKKWPWETVVRAEAGKDTGCHSNNLRQLKVATPLLSQFQLLWQSAINWVDINNRNAATVLEVGSPTSRWQQIQLLVWALFLVLKWLASLCNLTQ